MTSVVVPCETASPKRMTMTDAGYDADFPEDVSGSGDPSLWNGLNDSSIESY